ncbi:hypothetical protein [Microbacterium forte]|uniref:hypothetical protein n=1 Tax=Microbacterium forte TaxID=2982533 RepID=UPI002893619B|nr:hypothetical protein [Microbacterium sp. A(2022)]
MTGKKRESLTAPEIFWTIIAIGGVVLFVVGVVLMVNGEPISWLTFVSTVLTTSLAVGAFVASRRDRRRRSASPAAPGQSE